MKKLDLFSGLRGFKVNYGITPNSDRSSASTALLEGPPGCGRQNRRSRYRRSSLGWPITQKEINGNGCIQRFRVLRVFLWGSRVEQIEQCRTV